jgi:Vitamin K-dependent gamma-carboxylase
MNFFSRSWWRRHWDGFWFTPTSPRNLAAARIVFSAYSLWVLASRSLADVSGLPPDFWSRVDATARWRYLDFPGHFALERILVWVAGTALVCAMLGILSRLSCFVAGILLYHLAPLESIIWIPHPYARGLTISVLALLTLSFSPCGDCLVLQPLSRRPKAVTSDDYTWPVRLIQVFLVEIYLFSGYAKIAVVGWKWASPSNIRNWVLYCIEEDQIGVFHSFGAWIADRPLVCLAMGVGTLVFELGLVTVLFSKTARRVLVPMVALFHLAILLSMNLTFLNVPQLLVFADWDVVAAWVKRRRANAAGQQVPIQATRSTA